MLNKNEINSGYIDELDYPHCYSTFLSIVFIDYLLKVNESEVTINSKSKQNIISLLQKKKKKTKVQKTNSMM